MECPGVYILRCKNDRYYIGSTNDKERRFEEHCRGHVTATKLLLPVIMVFFQPFTTLKEARRVEQKLKKLKSHQILEQIIKDGYYKGSGYSMGR